MRVVTFEEQRRPWGKTLGIGAAVIVAGVVFAMAVMLRGGTARTPEVFHDGFTLEQAVARGKQEHKPVLAVVTADWCQPCQHLKRESLSDARVAALIQARAIPVYVNADKDREATASLGVMSVPVTAVLVDGKIVAKKAGFLPPDEYLSFVSSALEMAKKP